MNRSIILVLQLTNIVGILPLEPDLQVVTLEDDVAEPLEECVTLLLRQAMDVPWKLSNLSIVSAHISARNSRRQITHTKNAFPTRDWISPNHGVICEKIRARIIWRSSGLVVECKI